jgi:poly-beta-1,6-N-acetyl-D-glucosamine synthase
MRIAVIVPFLDEAEHLGTLLESVAAQTRPPDRMLLVNDGSQDGSQELASAFARAHPFATALDRPRRPVGPDRLATGGALVAFEWGVDQLEEPWDVVVKLDADVQLTPETFATIEHELEADPSLGMAGAHLSELDERGVPARMVVGPGHVHGATTFYRRECYEQITPLPAIAGWDMIDASRARMHGWRTESFAIPGGDPLHLRPMGTADGLLRAFRRWGSSAYVLGEHPLHVLLYGLVRMRQERPRVLGGANYLLGYVGAAVRRVPRAEPELRAFVHRDQLRRVARRLGSMVLPGVVSRRTPSTGA